MPGGGMGGGLRTVTVAAGILDGFRLDVLFYVECVFSFEKRYAWERSMCETWAQGDGVMKSECSAL